MSRRNRTENNRFKLFNTNITPGWTVLRRISFGDGERQVDLRMARRVYDEAGEHIGYQRWHAPASSAGYDRVVMVSAPSCRAFSWAEVQAIAGCCGRSKTLHMTDEQRATRLHPKTKKLLPETDVVERAIEKFAAWPSVGDILAPRISPRG
jgi:hypothetical protein